MIYVDSNYWIYWLDSRLPEHKHVTRTMRSAIREGITVSYVMLIEVAHYLRMLPREEFVRLTDAMRNLSTLKILWLHSFARQEPLGRREAANGPHAQLDGRVGS